jgi:hypothetical protein
VGAHRTRPKLRPSLAERAADELGERLAADGGPLDMTAKIAATLAAAADLASTALTPRGPEPVLGR